MSAAGESSPHYPYLSLLPSTDELHCPILWSDEERSRLLRASHLSETVAQTRQQLLEQWRAIEAAAASASIAELLQPAEVYNAGTYLWAHAIVLSRAHAPTPGVHAAVASAQGARPRP